MWLSFEEYTALGGSSVKRSEFNALEFKARKKIEHLTLNRIETPDEDIKQLVFQIVEMQHGFDKRDPSVSGYGNDGTSVSYVSPEEAKKDFDSRVEELITETVGDLAYRGI